MDIQHLRAIVISVAGHARGHRRAASPCRDSSTSTGTKIPTMGLAALSVSQREYNTTDVALCTYRKYLRVMDLLLDIHRRTVLKCFRPTGFCQVKLLKKLALTVKFR